MPVIRSCPFCRKGFLKSTYQMIEHVQLKHKSTILRNSRSFNTVKESKNNTSDTTDDPVLGYGKNLYKGKYGNSLYEPADMFNDIKNEIISVELEANNSSKMQPAEMVDLDDNPLHFNY